MSTTLNYLGAVFLVITAVVLLAGLGWRRLAAGGLIALFAAVGAGVVFGALAYRLALRFNPTVGHGTGAVLVGFGVGAVAALIVLVLTLVWLVRTNRVALERAAVSRVWLLLGAAGVVVVGLWAAKLVVKANPSLASTDQLARSYAETTRPDVEDELVRRRQDAVPSILEVLENRATLATEDDERVEPAQLAQLTRVLGKIGGPDALAALKKLLADDPLPEVRVAAALALAEHHDATGLPLLVEQLEQRRDPDWRQQQPAMLRALGELKATNHVGVIRAALTPGTNGPAGSVPSFLRIRAGVTALAAINTDEAWAAIGELAVSPEKTRRTLVMSALEHCTGPRKSALLLTGLNDPEPAVREAAYGALLRSEPKLKSGLENKWSEANAQKVRELLKPPSVAP